MALRAFVDGAAYWLKTTTSAIWRRIVSLICFVRYFCFIFTSYVCLKMKRRSCVVSIEVIDLPKKQRLDLKTCVPLRCKDFSELPTLIECKRNLKRTANSMERIIESVQSQNHAKESDMWKRRKSNFDDCVEILNTRTMPCENAQPLKTTSTGSNFERSDEFNCFNYWRVAPPDLELDEATSTCSRMEEEEDSTFVDSCKDANDKFNSFHYWRSSLPTIDELN